MTNNRFLRAAALGVAMIAASIVSGCESPTVDKFPDAGQVTVTVKDQNEAPVSGVTVDLLVSDNSIVWRSAVTDATGSASPGAADGGVLPGVYNVRITPPAGYHLDSRVSNSIPITIQSGNKATLTIHILTGP